MQLEQHQGWQTFELTEGFLLKSCYKITPQLLSKPAGIAEDSILLI